MRIGLISDTHGFLDPKVFEYFSECDEIWHAGDIGEMSVTTSLSEFKPLRAVFGNIDGRDIQIKYPEDDIFECEGLKVLMTHIGGGPPNYNPRSRKLIESHRPDIFICGHSHILKIGRDAKHNLLFINPGAAGNHGFHKIKTIVRFEITGKQVANMQVVELGKRGAISAGI